MTPSSTLYTVITILSEISLKCQLSKFLIMMLSRLFFFIHTQCCCGLLCIIHRNTTIGTWSKVWYKCYLPLDTFLYTLNHLRLLKISTTMCIVAKLHCSCKECTRHIQEKSIMFSMMHFFKYFQSTVIWHHGYRIHKYWELSPYLVFKSFTYCYINFIFSTVSCSVCYLNVSFLF